MRHRVSGFKLGRNTEHRRAMWRNMANSLFTHGQITTTVTRAKSVRPFIEKLITAARKGDLASRRRVIASLEDRIAVRTEDDPDVRRNRYGEVVGGPRVVKKLFDEIAPRFADRAGGYTRIVRLGRHRIGDGGDLCVLQLVGEESGPSVSGQFSRRREQADRRMAFAARQRRQGDGAVETASATEAPPEEEAVVAEVAAAAEAVSPEDSPADEPDDNAEKSA